MDAQVDAIAHRLREELTRIYGDRLKGLWLYGSHARGEAHEGSDIDVAMVLEDYDRDWDEIRRTGELISEICIDTGYTVALIPFRALDWQKQDGLLAPTIQREGVPLL